MRPLRLFILASITLILGFPASALDLGFAKEDAGHAGAFLDFAASARSLGMGRAHVAVADDSSAGYWNPAGLSQLNQQDIVTLYSSMEEDTGFGFLSYAQPTYLYGTFGLSIINLQSNDFERRDKFGTLNGTFDQSEVGLLLSHGFDYSPRWSFGSTVKAVRQDINNYKDTGYGLDLGVLMHIHPKFKTGLVLQNIVAPQLTLRSVEDNYPRYFKLGFNYQPTERWLVATDVSQTENRSVKINLGSEFQLGRGVALRAGINESEISAGLGIKIGSFDLDYAFGYQDAAAEVKDLGGTHRFGFHLTFGPKFKEQGMAYKWQKRGEAFLKKASRLLEEGSELTPDRQSRMIAEGEMVLMKKGFADPLRLYSAQAYLYYLKGDYVRSINSFEEALAIDPANTMLANHSDYIRNLLTLEHKNQVIAHELKTMREKFKKADYNGALRSAQKILKFEPEHKEALDILKQANEKIQGPINTGLRLAQSKFDKGEYLAAIKHLQRVKQMDPNNGEAERMMSRAIKALEKKATIQYRLPEKEESKEENISRDPKRSRELYSEGLALYSKGDLKKAESAWTEAVDLDPSNTLAKKALERVQSEINENAEPATKTKAKEEPAKKEPKQTKKSEKPKKKVQLIEKSKTQLTDGSRGRSIYTVQAGDTLPKIARRMYGSGSKWKRIYTANKHLIGEMENIEPGQKIIIP